jgi:hypothetical protein
MILMTLQAGLRHLLGKGLDKDVMQVGLSTIAHPEYRACAVYPEYAMPHNEWRWSANRPLRTTRPFPFTPVCLFAPRPRRPRRCSTTLSRLYETEADVPQLEQLRVEQLCRGSCVCVLSTYVCRKWYSYSSRI